MASQDGHSAPDLREKILARARGANFFQIVRTLNRVARQSGAKALGPATRANDEQVRFRAALGMRYPALDITDARLNSDRRAEVVVAFMGLTGPTGALPDFYTELAVAQRQARRPSLIDFLDLFNHRTISHFYRAWAKYRLPVRYEEAPSPLTDPYSVALASLAGLGLKAQQASLQAQGEQILGVSGLLARGRASPQGLKHILMAHFNLPVEVDELRAHLITIPLDERTTLGRNSKFAELGATAVLGAQVWDIQSQFRIKIGPLDLTEFNRFFDDDALRKEFSKTVKFAAGHGLEFDIHLVLKKEQVPRARLGGGALGVRLGQTSWLHEHGFDQDRDDAVIFC